MNVTVESLKKAGHVDAEKTFKEIAVAGGFGDIDPSHPGGLDVDNIGDPKAKASVAALLSSPASAPAIKAPLTGKDS